MLWWKLSRDKIAKAQSSGRGVPKSQNLAFPNSPSEAIEPLTPRQGMYSSDGDNRIGHSSVSKFLYNGYGDSGKDTRVLPMVKDAKSTPFKSRQKSAAVLRKYIPAPHAAGGCKVSRNSHNAKHPNKRCLGTKVNRRNK